MGRVTGRQRSTITKQAKPAPMLMPWEVNHQHRIEDFFKASHDTSNTFQGTVSPTHSLGNARDTVSQKDNEDVTMNSLISLVIPETNGSKDCSGLEVIKKKDQLLENCERETCGSCIISDDGKVKPSSKREASSPPTELQNSRARIAAWAGGGDGHTLGPGPLTSQKQSPAVQSEVMLCPEVEQSNLVLKAIKYHVKYNLDEVFNYTFTPRKVSLKQRLMSK